MYISNLIVGFCWTSGHFSSCSLLPPVLIAHFTLQEMISCTRERVLKKQKRFFIISVFATAHYPTIDVIWNSTKMLLCSCSVIAVSATNLIWRKQLLIVTSSLFPCLPAKTSGWSPSQQFRISLTGRECLSLSTRNLTLVLDLQWQKQMLHVVRKAVWVLKGDCKYLPVPM